MQTATKTAAKPRTATKVSAPKEPKRLSAIAQFWEKYPGGVLKIADQSLYKELGLVL